MFVSYITFGFVKKEFDENGHQRDPEAQIVGVHSSILKANDALRKAYLDKIEDEETRTRVSSMYFADIEEHAEGAGFQLIVHPVEANLSSPMGLINSYEQAERCPSWAIKALKTSRVYGDWGCSALAITHTEVWEVFLKYPAQWSSWMKIRSHRYDTIEQLKQTIDRLMVPEKASCWG